MGKRRAPTAFATGRREGVKTGASKKKFLKWQAIRKGTLGKGKIPGANGKKLNAKQRQQAQKRQMTKNYGRAKK